MSKTWEPLNRERIAGEENYSEVHQWNTADALTLVRMAASVLLFCLPLGSFRFFLAYTIAGLTDALDGWLARRSGKASEFGARLDSAADLLFYGVVLWKLFPILYERMPTQIWYAVGGVLLLRLLGYAVAAVRYRRFAALHTGLNKLTGLCVFSIAYLLNSPALVPAGCLICLLAAIAAGQELLLHLFS